MAGSYTASAMDVTIVSAALDDHQIVEIDGLLQRAYRAPSRTARVTRWRQAQPDGWVVALETDRIVGCGGFIAYGHATTPFGWIGLIATEPTHERRGIGRAVTEALVDRLAAGGRAAVLDASDAGAPVYERMGFRDHGVARTLMLPRDRRFAPTGRSGDLQVVDLATVADVDLEEFDLARFGGDRRRLLRLLRGDFAARGRAAVVDGRLLGYGIAQDVLIGPLVAETPEALLALVSSLVPLFESVEPMINLPADSMHLATLLGSGWADRRQLRHMRLGVAALPGRRGELAGQVSYGEG
jgi:predicted N-acetyltransferase YhbS